MLRVVLIHTLLGALLVLPAVAGDKPGGSPGGQVGDIGPSELEPIYQPRDFPDRADPPLPDPAAFPVQLVLDDDGAEGVFGFSGGSARQFLWLNHFAGPGPFKLEEIWVLFPSGMDVPEGGDVQLAVYLDPDGDPATGARLLATYDQTIQAVDGNTFSVYPLDPPVNILDSGDVLIGVVNRYFTTDDDPPPTLPAALDTTDSQDRSYFALWADDPPEQPDLDTAIVVDLLDGNVSGNFMIRGFGRPFGVPFIPTMGGFGLALLAALLGLAGLMLVRRRVSSCGPSPAPAVPWTGWRRSSAYFRSPPAGPPDDPRPPPASGAPHRTAGGALGRRAGCRDG